jgi:hypothetical protein
MSLRSTRELRDKPDNIINNHESLEMIEVV